MRIDSRRDAQALGAHTGNAYRLAAQRIGFGPCGTKRLETLRSKLADRLDHRLEHAADEYVALLRIDAAIGKRCGDVSGRGDLAAGVRIEPQIEPQPDDDMRGACRLRAQLDKDAAELGQSSLSRSVRLHQHKIIRPF